MFFVTNTNYVLGRIDTLSAFHIISDISLIIINVWIVITTCQLLPKLTSYYVLKFANLKHNLKIIYIIEKHIPIHIIINI